MRTRVAGLGTPSLIRCGIDDPAPQRDAYAVQTLNGYRQALPDQNRLLAGAPVLDERRALTSRGGRRSARSSRRRLARSINRPVRALVAPLRTIAELEPTRFDAAVLQLMWRSG